MNHDNSIRNGSFEAIVYDNKGNVVARKTINVNGTTTMNDTRYGNSIVKDFNSNSDDNKDNNMLNDVDDFLRRHIFMIKILKKAHFLSFQNKLKGFIAYR